MGHQDKPVRYQDKQRSRGAQLVAMFVAAFIAGAVLWNWSQAASPSNAAPQPARSNAAPQPAGSDQPAPNNPNPLPNAQSSSGTNTDTSPAIDPASTWISGPRRISQSDIGRVTGPIPADSTVPLDSIIAKLDFLKSPIAGAKITSANSQLPGAPRTYRNGIHQGVDFYAWSTGADIRMGTAVLAAADGVIIRIDHDYVEMNKADRDSLLQAAKNEADTPDETLDKLNGRQVWIMHEGGIITRYTHLASVAESLRVGDRVQAGQVIAGVGNSGTNDGALQTQNGAHLDFQIFINYEPWFKGVSIKDTRVVLERILQ